MIKRQMFSLIKIMLLILTYSLIALIFTTCIKKDDKLSEHVGLNVFDKDKNYIEEYLPTQDIVLSELINKKNSDTVTLISREGKMYQVTEDMRIQNENDTITCITDTKQMKDIVAIYLSDNPYSITETYEEMKASIDGNEKIMVVLLDGFSYQQYQLGKEKGYIPFLEPFFRHEALSVYTPVTNAGFAAIITGKTPDENGVHNREHREMMVKSIFGYANKKGKKSLLLEGDIKILKTEIEPILHTDANNNGDVDDDIFESIIKKDLQAYDLVFVHFHGIDDRGHTYGPTAEETLEYIKEIDQYLKEISLKWEHTMIITADHGMDQIDTGGYHGKGNTMDMVVPYFKK